MIVLQQQKNFLVASENAIKMLAEKKSARILVVSDSHGSAHLFEKIICAFGKTCDALIFCGDGIGDVAFLLQKASDDKHFEKLFPSVCCFVRGNGDASSFPVRFLQNENSPKNFYASLTIPKKQIIEIAHQKIFVCHGHEQGAYYGCENIVAEANKYGARLAFFGHVHIASESRMKVYAVNPGSISFPRGASPHSFAISEIGKDAIDTTFYKIDARMNAVHFTPFFPKANSRLF